MKHSPKRLRGLLSTLIEGAVLVMLLCLFVVIAGVPIPYPLSEDDKAFTTLYVRPVQAGATSTYVLWDAGWENPAIKLRDVILVTEGDDVEFEAVRFFQFSFSLTPLRPLYSRPANETDSWDTSNRG